MSYPDSYWDSHFESGENHGSVMMKEATDEERKILHRIHELKKEIEVLYLRLNFLLT